MIKEKIDGYLKDLFPLNRSLTGKDNVKTIKYLITNILEDGEIKSIPSGKKVFDWTVPPNGM